MQINDKLINRIVDTVVQRLSENDPPNNLQVDRTGPQNPGSPGVFQNMDDCIPAAVAAQKKLLNLSFETRRLVIQAIRDTGKANAAEYGRLEFEETDLGKRDDNVAKNRSSCEVLGMEDLVPEVYAGDKGVTIIDRIPGGRDRIRSPGNQRRTQYPV